MSIPVARLWHKKGKLEYYTMLQLLKYLPDIEFEYHVILDQPNYKDEWTEKIDLSNEPIDMLSLGWDPYQRNVDLIGVIKG